MLVERGYTPVELTSVMYLPLESGFAGGGDVAVRVADDRELWARTAGEGWRGSFEGEALLDLMRVAANTGAVLFLAEMEGRAVAAGALHIQEGVGLLAGASTIPEFRKKGAQRALLNARLRYAAEAGCELAMMGAEAGSGSQRNAERQGFRIAYTRVKWRHD